MDKELPANLTPSALEPHAPVVRGAEGTKRREEIYELFVLGELIGGPLHGYLLREILGNILGPFRKISWGTVYPLIHSLEEEKYIVPVPEPAGPHKRSRGRGRQRVFYELSEKGRQHFYRLMESLPPYTADYPDLFTIKLNYFGLVTVARCLEILHHHQGYLQIESGYLTGAQGRITARTSVSENERKSTLRMLSYRLSGVQSQLAWTENEIARMEHNPR